MVQQFAGKSAASKLVEGSRKRKLRRESTRSAVAAIFDDDYKGGGGTVNVEVVRASALPRADKQSSDPYLMLSLGEQKFKTTTKKKTLDPEWNESFTFAFRSWAHLKARATRVPHM